MSVVKDLSLGAVVVALDGQNADGAAVDWAVDEAVRRGRPLHLVATGEQSSPESPLAPMVPFDAVDPTEALAQAAARVSRLVPDLDVRTTGIEGRLVPLLLGASETADTVVVTGRGTGRVRSVLLGSTAIQVASHASCPVVVVPPDASPRPRGHVVVGVDGSPLSAEAVGYAYLQAAERGTGLTVVHAWQVDPIEESIRYAASDAFWSERSDPEIVVTAESLAGWAEKYPDVVVRRRVVRSAAVEAIVAESDGAGLVVVGSRGWGDVRGALLGSVSQGCLRRVHGPVAVVRPRAAAGAR